MKTDLLCRVALERDIYRIHTAITMSRTWSPHVIKLLEILFIKSLNFVGIINIR